MINEDLSLNTRFFKIADTVYEVIGTEVGKNGVYNAIDKVRNNNTQEIKKMRRAELNILINKYKAKKL